MSRPAARQHLVPHPAVAAFEAALKAEGVRTYRRYALQAGSFLWWMEARTQKSFSSAAVTRADVLAYRDEVQRRRPLSGSVEVTTMLRRFFRYEQERGAITASPLDGVRVSLVPPRAQPQRGEPRSSVPDRLAIAQRRLPNPDAAVRAAPARPATSPTAPAAVAIGTGDRPRYPLLEQAIAERRRGRGAGRRR